MLTLAQTRATPREQALRDELDELNTQLRELHSTDLGVRAYIETWLAAVGFLALAKLLADWIRMHSKWPWLGVPVALLATCLMADSLVQRAAQRRLARIEDQKLKRQRELRLALGIDDAVFPASKAA